MTRDNSLLYRIVYWVVCNGIRFITSTRSSSLSLLYWRYGYENIYIYIYISVSEMQECYIRKVSLWLLLYKYKYIIIFPISMRKDFLFPFTCRISCKRSSRQSTQIIYPWFSMATFKRLIFLNPQDCSKFS